MLAKLPVLNANDAQQVLRDVYEREYGIFDHLGAASKSRPLSGVELHYAESPAALASVTDYIKQYVSKELHKYGISFEAYMNMPGSVAKDIIMEIDSKQHKADAEVRRALEGK